VLVIASGTQAEPQSAIARLAANDHPRLSLEAGDAVVFSSRTIPGNERAVWSLLCDLERRGVDVHFSQTDQGIHVSGHACREEQARMIRWTQPHGFVPVHGTYHHLLRHGQLARALGVRDVCVIENGQTAMIDRGGLQQGASVRVGRVSVSNGGEIPDEVLRERRVMGEVGAVFVTVPVTRLGVLTGRVTVAARGVVIDGAPGVVEEEARLAIETAVNEIAHTTSHDHLREAVRRATRKVYARAQSKPMVVVAIQTA
jgi:ribonuclease J